MKKGGRTAKSRAKCGDHEVKVKAYDQLQERLHKAISLGLRHKDGKRKEWWNNDGEVQGQALRVISAFVTTLTPSLSRQPSVQASLKEVMVALQGLLQSESEQIYNAAAEIVVKLTALLGGSLFKFGIEELVLPLVKLLSCPKTTTATACAASLNNILENIKPRSTLDGKSGSGERVWKIFQEANTVGVIVQQLENYESDEARSAEYYLEFADLLSKILWWLPTLRYVVGNNRNLRFGLLALCRCHNSETASAALRASSALALCGKVAMKQVEDKEVLWSAIQKCLDDSRPRVLRVEAFRFLQILVRSPTGCNVLTGAHVGSLMNIIVEAMAEWRSCLNEKWQPDLEMLVLEACHTANRLLRWSGEHHFYFWKMDIAKVLFDMLLLDHSDVDICKKQEACALTVSLHINKHPVIRSHLWDTLGWLAIHYEGDLGSNMSTKKEPLLRLISFACEMSVKAVYRRGQLHIQSDRGSQPRQDIPDISEREPICRAILFLIFSPCKYLASQTRHFLEKALEPYGHEWLQSLLNTIALGACDNGHSVSDSLQMVLSLIALVNFSSLEQYCQFLQNYNALEILACAIRFHSASDLQVARANVSNHVFSTSDAKVCCWNDRENWEGKNLILFFTLWAFAKLVRDSGFARDVGRRVCVEGFTDDVDCGETEVTSLIKQLQKLVADNSYSDGVRWYAAHSMASIGMFGFPSKLGWKMRKAFGNDEMADLLLILSDGHSLYAHSVILAARCPPLLPSSHLHLNQNKHSLSDGLPKENATEKLQQKVNKVVRLSSKLHYPALRNVLEFAYSGIVQVDEENMADVRLLAKRCNLEPLLSLLSGKTPNWGICVPDYNIASALGAIGHLYSDVILQAKGQECPGMKCSVCILPTKHVHVHRIVLASNSGYQGALFRSGMRDSSSEVIQVPVGWEALSKLVKFFYTGLMNCFEAGCSWTIMDMEQQLNNLQAYIELCWLGEQWFIEDVSDICLSVVCEKIKLNSHLCPKVIQKAADYKLWTIVEEAAECMAPAYTLMRDRGELEELDNELVEIVRVAHVQLYQNDKKWE